MWRYDYYPSIVVVLDLGSSSAPISRVAFCDERGIGRRGTDQPGPNRTPVVVMVPPRPLCDSSSSFSPIVIRCEQHTRRKVYIIQGKM